MEGTLLSNCRVLHISEIEESYSIILIAADDYISSLQDDFDI
jgi:hypothetical protein